MAIFYNHIKGCGYGTTGAEKSATDLWTWIKWASVENNDTVDEAQQRYLPEIWINIKKAINIFSSFFNFSPPTLYLSF